MKKRLLNFLLILISSCSQVGTIGFQKHDFGMLPLKIIWFQLPGLDEEHISLLKFPKPQPLVDGAFDQFMCFGKAWSYNLFNLRNSASTSYLAQMTGKKNIKNECNDYRFPAIWKLLDSNTFSTAILEHGVLAKDSLSIINRCDLEQAKSYLDEVVLFKMTRAQSSLSKPQLFHISQNSKEFQPSQTYYDQSCQTGECFTTMARNIDYITNSFLKNKKNYLLMIRDFSYLNALKNNNISQAQKALLDISNIISELKKKIDLTDTLVLLSSAESLTIDFPEQGASWRKFEKTGKGINIKKSRLISPIFALGAGAENFCGIYEEAELMTRILKKSQDSGFRLLNIF